MYKITTVTSLFAFALMAVMCSALSTPARADEFLPFGNVTVVTDADSNLAWQITSDNSAVTPYGGLYLTLPATDTLASLTTLSMVVGGGPDEAGSIQFVLDASDGMGAAFAYPGGETNTDPNGGAIAPTVNFITSTGLNWDNNGAGVFSGPEDINYPFVTYSELEALDGSSTSINEIDVIAESGYVATQVFDVESVDVNGVIYTPSATAAASEPGSLALLCFGLIGLAVLYRRKATASVRAI